MKRYVLAVDLKDDQKAIRAYEKHHRAVWPEVVSSLRSVGVRQMDIYRLNRRLVMVLETEDDFALRRNLAEHVASDPRCAEWEALMQTFQQPPPGANPGDWWTVMDPIFQLQTQPAPRSRRNVRKSHGAPSTRAGQSQ